MHTILEMVKDNTVFFKHLRQGIAYYGLFLNDSEFAYTYTFPVPLEDIGDATLLSNDNAIYFMRYIRKAIENKEISLSKSKID